MPRKRIAVRKPILQAYVVERLAYIDSVFVKGNRKIDLADLERLKATLTPDARFSDKRYFGRYKPYINEKTGECFYHYVHIIHQPTKATFCVMQDIQDRNPGIFSLLEVHFALDLITSSDRDADHLHEALLGVFVPARLKSKDQEYSTTYMGTTYGGNEMVAYSDDKSKVRPESPVVHLEWRIQGDRALKRANIKSMMELTEFNHRAFWAKRLRLRIMPTLPRLVRILECRAARNGRLLDLKKSQRTMNWLVRGSQDYLGRFSAQDLNDLLVILRHPRPSQLYMPISNTWALPKPGNALWDEE